MGSGFGFGYLFSYFRFKELFCFGFFLGGSWRIVFVRSIGLGFVSLGIRFITSLLCWFWEFS